MTGQLIERAQQLLRRLRRRRVDLVEQLQLQLRDDYAERTEDQ